jgi:L-alanine-DL-glutamate epimerase-like enolase superfamily enzyme
MLLNIKIIHQSLPLAQVFRISRGAKTSAEVIVVVISDGNKVGWGEAVPYGHYGETIESVSKQLKALSTQQISIENHSNLSKMLPAGSARNALDCAMWDLKAQLESKTVNELINHPSISSCITAQTISVDTTSAMQASARKLNNPPLVKVKLDADSVVDKMQAISDVCPNSRFIIDANEGWSIDVLDNIMKPLQNCNVVLIEQPLPASRDDELKDFDSPIPICADESVHVSNDLQSLRHKYDAINIKLDKTGGLSEAIHILRHARELDFQIMIGCMVGSSLGMAPAYTLCGFADFVDLDGPLLVAKDRQNGFTFENGIMSSMPPKLWGMGNTSEEASLLFK